MICPRALDVTLSVSAIAKSNSAEFPARPIELQLGHISVCHPIVPDGGEWQYGSPNADLDAPVGNSNTNLMFSIVSA